MSIPLSGHNRAPNALLKNSDMSYRISQADQIKESSTK